jgi:glycosyltransferase involved in cell wall biosynthesis
MRHETNILVIAKDPRHQGGYYEFVSMVLDRQGEAGGLDLLRIGRKVGDDSFLGKLTSIPSDHFRMRKALQSGKYQCILFNTSMNKSAFIRDALLIARARKIFPHRIVVQVHGWDDSFAGTIQKKVLYRRLFEASFKKVDKIIILARRFERQLLDLGVDIGQISLGTTMFDGNLLRGGAPKSLSEDGHLLFLSRLAVEKGPTEVLEAFRDLHERFPRLRLTMAGDGPELSNLRVRAESWGLTSVVNFPGYVVGDEKAKLLEEADVFLLPTRYGEGMPISILEAMAAGMPVIVTRAGAIGEHLEDRKNGLLLESGSPAQIIAALEYLLDNPEKCLAISELNKATAWDRFEATTVSKRLVDICRLSPAHAG